MHRPRKTILIVLAAIAVAAAAFAILSDRGRDRRGSGESAGGDGAWGASDTGSPGGDPDEVARSDRTKELEAKRQRLRRLIEAARSRAADSGHGDVEAREKRAPSAPEDALDLTGPQRELIRGALDRLYDPNELSAAIGERRAREAVESFEESWEAFLEEVGVRDGTADPAMEEAAQRMRAVRDYARAFLGCQRRPGHEGHERELMQRTNDIYGERFEDLVADYPFLDLPMVDLSGGGH